MTTCQNNDMSNLGESEVGKQVTVDVDRAVKRIMYMQGGSRGRVQGMPPPPPPPSTAQLRHSLVDDFLTQHVQHDFQSKHNHVRRCSTFFSFTSYDMLKICMVSP